jgi:lipopolysaccharide cholinephosphotransferase
MIDSQIRQIQLKCLEILDIVHDICTRNGIKYSLCGGSVVGAHLYKGCLPWDDDIDIMMTRENFNKFVKIAPKVLPKGYSLMSYHFCNMFFQGTLKIIDENTTYVQSNGEVLGVFLDITVFDRVPVNKLLKIIELFFAKRLLTALTGKLPINNLKSRIRNLFVSLFFSNKKKYFMFFEKMACLFSKKCSQYTYSELFFCAYPQTISYRSSVFENYMMIEFEGKEYMIVRDYIEYLTTRYNRTDFREPKEKQVAPHLILFNPNLPYKDYLKNSECNDGI